jgi:uncharacterized protein (TIGR02466 family)
MAKIESWFPTLIYSHTLDVFKDNDYLKEKSISLKDDYKSNSSTTWKCDTFNTLGQYYDYNSDKIIQKLIGHVKNHVILFSKNFGVKSENIECKNFWFNIAAPESYQEYHNHPNNHFSVVYYIQTPPKCGNIVFRSHDSFSDMYTLPIENYNENSYKTCFYTPYESMLIIFKSNILHMVEKNKSDSDRISIAMNFNYRG